MLVYITVSSCLLLPLSNKTFRYFNLHVLHNLEMCAIPTYTYNSSYQLYLQAKSHQLLTSLRARRGANDKKQSCL